MANDFKKLIEQYAIEEELLPDLLQEFIYLNPEISKNEAIKILASEIKENFKLGIIGLYSHIPQKNSGFTNISAEELDAVLSNFRNWDFHKMDEIAFSLVLKWW